MAHDGGQAPTTHRWSGNFVDDTIESFRVAAIQLCRCASAFDRRIAIRADALETALTTVWFCPDAVDIWRSQGIENPDAVPDMAADDFIALANRIREPRYDAR